MIPNRKLINNKPIYTIFNSNKNWESCDKGKSDLYYDIIYIVYSILIC